MRSSLNGCFIKENEGNGDSVVKWQFTEYTRCPLNFLLT
nr:MAG TPA: hypothetical protein [Caudoviricetes sp.]